MTAFKSYADYYDLLYENKDYVGESDYIEKILNIHSPGTKTILELGCGTGAHAYNLAKKGYSIHALDISENMLLYAKQRLSSLPLEIQKNIKLDHADIRSVRVKQKFDAVISLFHVMCYQNTNEDLQATLETAYSHLNSGGIFIFDCWYGPAVLTEKPEVRVHRYENNEIIITRIAEPTMHPNENLVDVDYQIFIENKNTHVVEELKEQHKMRYLFIPELLQLFKQTSFDYISGLEWQTDSNPNINTWNVYFVLRKQ